MMSLKYSIILVTFIILNTISSIVTGILYQMKYIIKNRLKIYLFFKDSCTPSTCKNNAECENVFDSFICHCAEVRKIYEIV